MSGPKMRSVVVEKVRAMDQDTFAAYTVLVSVIVGGFAVGVAVFIYEMAELVRGCVFRRDG